MLDDMRLDLSLLWTLHTYAGIVITIDLVFPFLAEMPILTPREDTTSGPTSSARLCRKRCRADGTILRGACK
jgi:hypothetical protein